MKPKYESLKQELTNNRHHRISEEQFNELRQICQQYLVLDLKANDIGRGNEICCIRAGSSITIAHLIAMKLYTDFDDTQREFKRHCRRLYKGESVESVMERNQEIAIWCRLMREYIMFWGKTMTKKQVFYCGLSARLVLSSTHQRFECPLSTTGSFDVAQQFSDDLTGAILMLKRANAKTRCLDVSAISGFSNEDERLFMGSTLKIKGISVYDANAGKWEALKPKGFVSALAMFEQIYNGHFIGGNAATRSLLLSLLRREMTDLETGRSLNESSIPRYCNQLFAAFLEEMKNQNENGNIWINHRDLDRKEHLDIKMALFGEGMLFDHLSIDKSKINAVQQFEWMIEGDEYIKCKQVAADVASKYVQSRHFEYHIDSDTITLHFNFYGRMKFEAKEYCGIFVEIDEMPQSLNGFNIEVDIKCNEKKAYRQLLRDQKLTAKKRICGFRIFRTSELDKNTFLHWIFGVKIFNLKKLKLDTDDVIDGFEEMDFDEMYIRLSDLY